MPVSTPPLMQWFSRDPALLGGVLAFFDGFAASTGWGQTDVFPLRLAVEEVFLNMATHNAEGPGRIAIAFRKTAGHLEATLQDPDSDPYDITRHEAPNVRASLAERKGGGLGLYLVNRLLDEVHYDYTGGTTTVRLVKVLTP